MEGRLLVDWGPQLARGAAMTMAVALTTLPIGLTLGLAIALCKQSHRRWVRGLAEGYTTVFRGLPELLTLLLIYYGSQILTQRIAEAFGSSASVDMSPFAAGVTALALVFGAYSSEVLLSALRGVDRGQIEAARSFGMSPALVFRRITAPQALRLALPGLGNNWLVLLKDTSLVSVIALNDLLRQTSVAVERTREPFKFYAAACVLYLAMTAASTLLIARAEKAAGRGWRSER